MFKEFTNVLKIMFKLSSRNSKYYFLLLVLKFIAVCNFLNVMLIFKYWNFYINVTITS
jgi:hypothetical protein